MLSGEDFYTILSGVMPLYVAIALGYASIKFGRIFNSSDCNAMNRFSCYCATPFLTFQLVSRIVPDQMNFKFIAGITVGNFIVAIALAFWLIFSKNKDYSWAITTLYISTFKNTVFVGVPMLEAMYGPLGADLVTQASAISIIFWWPVFLLLIEIRRTYSIIEMDTIELEEQVACPRSNNLRSIIGVVCMKIARNPNIYAPVVGLVWAFIAKRWNIQMPDIIEGSIALMATSARAVSMFVLGLFMGLQDRIVACGFVLASYGMFLTFFAAPLTMGIGCFAFGLRSDPLRIAIIQAALPEAVTAFTFAQEYNLHGNVHSTVIFLSTIASLPLLLGYYAILRVIH